MRGVNPGLDFDYILEPNIARVIDPAVPERAIAYSSEWLVSEFDAKQMRMMPPIRWGCWSGKQPAYSGQDILIFEKLS